MLGEGRAQAWPTHSCDSRGWVEKGATMKGVHSQEGFPDNYVVEPGSGQPLLGGHRGGCVS